MDRAVNGKTQKNECAKGLLTAKKKCKEVPFMLDRKNEWEE